MKKFTYCKNDLYVVLDYGYSPYWNILPQLMIYCRDKESYGFVISFLWVSFDYQKGLPF